MEGVGSADGEHINEAAGEVWAAVLVHVQHLSLGNNGLAHPMRFCLVSY